MKKANKGLRLRFFAISLVLIGVIFALYVTILNQSGGSATLTITEWTDSHWLLPDEHPAPIITSQEISRGDVITLRGLSSIEGTIRIQRISDDYVVIRVTSNGISNDPRTPLPSGGQTFEIPFEEVLRLETLTMSSIVSWALVFTRG